MTQRLFVPAEPLRGIFPILEALRNEGRVLRWRFQLPLLISKGTQMAGHRIRRLVVVQPVEFARNFALEKQSSEADEPPWCPHKQQSERKKKHNYENYLEKVEHKKQRISEGVQAKSVRGCASHSVHGRRPYR